MVGVRADDGEKHLGIYIDDDVHVTSRRWFKSSRLYSLGRLRERIYCCARRIVETLLMNDTIGPYHGSPGQRSHRSTKADQCRRRRASLGVMARGGQRFPSTADRRPPNRTGVGWAVLSCVLPASTRRRASSFHERHALSRRAFLSSRDCVLRRTAPRFSFIPTRGTQVRVIANKNIYFCF